MRSYHFSHTGFRIFGYHNRLIKTPPGSRPMKWRTVIAIKLIIEMNLVKVQCAVIISTCSYKPVVSVIIKITVNIRHRPKRPGTIGNQSSRSCTMYGTGSHIDKLLNKFHFSPYWSPAKLSCHAFRFIEYLPCHYSRMQPDFVHNRNKGIVNVGLRFIPLFNKVFHHLLILALRLKKVKGEKTHTNHDASFMCHIQGFSHVRNLLRTYSRNIPFRIKLWTDFAVRMQPPSQRVSTRFFYIIKNLSKIRLIKRCQIIGIIFPS